MKFELTDDASPGIMLKSTLPDGLLFEVGNTIIEGVYNHFDECIVENVDDNTRECKKWLSWSCTYKDCKRHGIFYDYCFGTGELWSESLYKNDIKYKFISYRYHNGDRKIESIDRQCNGYTRCIQIGNHRIHTFKTGKGNSKHRIYDVDGSIMSCETQCGSSSRVQRTVYGEDGNILYETTIIDGLEYGVVKHLNPTRYSVKSAGANIGRIHKDDIDYYKKTGVLIKRGKKGQITKYEVIGASKIKLQE